MLNVVHTLRAALIAILLAGCAAPAPDGSRAQPGERVEAPWGYTEWCAREPWQRACGGDGAAR